MELSLGRAAADELERVLDGVLSDLSYEIADTDRPEFRRQLRARRELLREVHDELRRKGSSPSGDGVTRSTRR